MRRGSFLLILVLVAVTAACSSSAKGTAPTVTSTVADATTGSDPTTLPATTTTTIPSNIYAADGPNMLSPVVKNFPTRIYVPNSLSDTVDEVDPISGAITRHFAVG